MYDVNVKCDWCGEWFTAQSNEPDPEGSGWYCGECELITMQALNAEDEQMLDEITEEELAILCPEDY